MQLSIASFAYPRVAEEERARLARVLMGSKAPAGVFVLSTCLRVEVAVPADEVALKETLCDLLGPSPIEPQVRQGEEAAQHLFRVAAGLDSPIVGEVEVLAQFRQALAGLRDSGAVDGRLLELLESAVATGREARRGMPFSPYDTMAGLAAQAVGPADRVAVIGAGTMARSVVAALAGLPAPPGVTVLARDPERVSLSGVQVLSMDSLTRVLSEFPVVISATAASKGLIGRDAMQGAVAGRATRLVLVDMAMPPDFEPSVGPVEYMGIDHLARLAERRSRPLEAETIVTRAAEETYHVLSTRGQAGPVIASIMAAADRVVEETVERFAGRLADEADREVLHQTAHTVARTLLNRPVSMLRASRDPDLVEVMSSVFEDD